MKNRYAVLLPLIVMLGSTGCSRLNNTDKGALGGAAAGAVTGAIIAATSSVHTGPGMGIGALIGGVVGAVVGGHIDQAPAADCSGLQDRIDSLTRERDELAAQLRACQEADNKTVAEDAGPLHARISDLEAEIARLNSRISDLEAEVARLNSRILELEAALAAKGGERPVLARYVIGNTILFGSGKAELSPLGRTVLDQAAAAIRDQYPTQNVVIEGHTDTTGISSSAWKSNWELGAGRALAVLHYLEDNSSIAGERLSATTYSFYRPVASNDTSDGKSQNRRTEIVVYAN